MAIITEYFTNPRGLESIRRFSDKKKFIENNGNLYEIAEDLIGYENERIYTETDILIESEVQEWE